MSKLSQDLDDSAAQGAGVMPPSPSSPAGSAIAKALQAPEIFTEPQGGGSYSCDPATGALTKIAGPAPDDHPVQE